MVVSVTMSVVVFYNGEDERKTTEQIERVKAMKSKPAHLGLKYAMQFQDQSIVDVYHHRSPYAP